MSVYSAGQSPPPVQSGITLAKTGLGTSNTATDSVTEAWQPLASVTTKVTGTSVTPPPSKTITTEGLTSVETPNSPATPNDQSNERSNPVASETNPNGPPHNSAPSTEKPATGGPPGWQLQGQS